MSAHTVHPDTHDHGLADDCPACLEHAEHPLQSLDSRNLTNLIQLAVKPDRFTEARSDMEAVATSKILNALENAGRIAETDLGTFVAYLRDRWNIPIIDVGAHRLAYERGVIVGMVRYAWWKDGVRYVGTTGTTLRQACERFMEERGHDEETTAAFLKEWF